MLSPPVSSPFVPSSKNGCVEEPPIEVRSPVTAKPVLVGFVPGVTVTVRRLDPPGTTTFGFAAPEPEGLVGVLVGAGARATLRNALFVPAVTIVENESPAAPVSVTVTSLLAASTVVADRTACPEPLVVNVTPRKPAVSPVVKVFARVQVLPPKVHFCNPPPEAIALSSAT